MPLPVPVFRATLLCVPVVIAVACASTGTSSPSGGDDGGPANTSGPDGASSGGSSGSGSSSNSSGSSGVGSSSGSSSGGSSSGSSGASSGGTSSGAVDAGGGDGATVRDCSSLPLCDGFESVTAGSPPSAALWSLVGGKGCSGSSPYSVTVDNTQHNVGGQQSVKVTGGDSCGPLMVNTTAFPKLTGGEVYGRFFVRLETATPVHHAALMALGFQADAGPLGNNTRQYLQLAAEEASNAGGATVGMLDWNFNDLTLPQKDSAGVAQTTYPSAGAWTCIEFHASAGTGAIETWVGGAAVPGMTYVPGVTADVQGVNGGWNAGRPPLSLQSIGFGWVDFSTSNTTVWFDDVAIAGTRIGCQ